MAKLKKTKGEQATKPQLQQFLDVKKVSKDSIEIKMVYDGAAHVAIIQNTNALYFADKIRTEVEKSEEQMQAEG